MFKSPTANSNDAFGLDLVSMPTGAIPESEFTRVAESAIYRDSQDRWISDRSNESRPYTEFYRLAWRRQISSNSERSLYAAIIPPGPTHIDLVHSLALADDKSTALASGFWASLPLDYFVRITGKQDLRFGGARSMPFGSLDHPLAPALLLRTMRLNCVTAAHANLWNKVYDEGWRSDDWVCTWDGLPPLKPSARAWEHNTPLRTERARRAALVEIDAIVAVWLGIDITALLAMYGARFPVLNRFEETMWFDANGWKLTGYHRTYGQIQKKTSYEEFQVYVESDETGPVPAGYTAPFYKADREAEYRQAHAVFTERMKGAGS
jgi:hypothetical protein